MSMSDWSSDVCSSDLSLGEGSSEATGVGLGVLATVCYGVALNLVAPLQARYGSRPVMARMLALATLWTLPLGVVGLPASELELRPLAAVAALGVLGPGIPFLLVAFLVGRVGPTRSLFITCLVPVGALALGVPFTGPPPRRG